VTGCLPPPTCPPHKNVAPEEVHPTTDEVADHVTALELTGRVREQVGATPPLLAGPGSMRGGDRGRVFSSRGKRFGV
jgi:hypothetical protein